MKLSFFAILLSSTSIFFACGGGEEDPEDSGDTEADRLGVAAECTEDADCPEVEIEGETVQLTCMTQFSGGYCAIEDCDTALDCPEGATCVAHDDGANYCFRECRDKSECNANRDADNEANCASNFEYAEPNDDDGAKACVPPSSGI